MSESRLQPIIVFPMNNWRIRQQKRRSALDKVPNVTTKPVSKTSNIDALRTEYVKHRDEWKSKHESCDSCEMSENIEPEDTVNIVDDIKVTPISTIRQEMMKIYVLYNPSKIGEIDALLAKYPGEEEALLERIKKKYTQAPEIEFSPEDMPGSTVYMDFTVDGAAVGRVQYRLYDSLVPLTVDNFRALCTGEKV